MSDIILMLRLEHSNLERVLACFERCINRLAAGNVIDCSILGAVIDYYRSFTETSHHPKEDLIFRRLAQRHPASAKMAADRIAEHALSPRTTLELASLLDDARPGNPDAIRRLVDASRDFIKAKREHSRLEDIHLFSAAMIHFQPEDWEEIEFAVFDDYDPLFRDSAEERFRELRQAIYAGEHHTM